MIFWCAAVVAALLYGLTVPDGLPWNESTRLAMAYLGGASGGLIETALPTGLPHPIWGFYVQVFGGPVALSVTLAALAAGFLGALFNRYLGWKIGIAAALVWIFLPGVWNRAITGERGVVLAAMVVVAVWVLNAIVLRVTRKARAARAASVADGGGGRGATALPAHGEEKKRGKVTRIVGWVVLGAAGLFAVVSATLHDYRLGEAASVYAKGVVEAAGERVIVLNGVVDEQIVEEVEKRGGGGERSCLLSSDETENVHCPPPPLFSTWFLSLRNTDANRSNVVAFAKTSFPFETNLWVAATVSPQTFVDAATKAHAERFYLMNGQSSTPEQWEMRWEAFKPHLGSRDRFVRIARRLFGYEGNAVANALLEKKVGGESNCNSTAAWQLYKRIYEEVDPGNISALINMSEMIRRGYKASGDEQKRVREKLETFFKDANNRRHAQRIVRASGPIRADPSLMEKMAAEAKKRIAAKIAAGEKVEYSPEVLSLVEWNNEMIKLMDKGDLPKAGRIARAILSNEKWRRFIPANAVMGAIASSEGDYVASERFYRAATDTTNKVAAGVLNDYADTLMHLGKLDEAEKMARRAVKETDEKTGWICRWTLAEVLEGKQAKANGEGREAKGKGAENRWIAEAGDLLKSVMKHAPKEAREKIRKEHKDFLR